MMDVLGYIRSLLFHNPFTSRKRRAADEPEHTLTPKFRRISTSQMSGSEDDWRSTASSSSLRHRSSLLERREPKHRPSWLKENGLITLDDDDDDVLEVKKLTDSFELLRKSSGHVTSTPYGTRLRTSAQNGDDDVTFVKCTQADDEKNRIAKKHGFEYIKPVSSSYRNLQNGASNVTSRLQNGARKRDVVSSIFNSVGEVKSKSGFPPIKRPLGTHSATLEQSFRLDEKRKYKELLSKKAPSSNKSLLSSFADYAAPVAKLVTYDNLSRGKKLVELSKTGNNKKALNIIDLTDVGKTKNNVRLSTRDTIKKVLNDYDSDVVVVKDSDSEVEILPTPPSPKADFQVEKCNSLKTYIDRSEADHDDWITNLIKRHNEVSKQCRKLIAEQQTNVRKCNNITEEIRSKLLDENVRKCLHIREVLLPDDEDAESTFPRLTPEQEAKICRALDKNLPGNEILAKQFNINISRQDMLTLSGLNWLNDEVINYYMNLIIERGKDEKWPKSYAFNTFFYPKISSGGQASVRRWTRKVDVFSYDIIAIPIHLRMHWCMAVIDFRAKNICYYDSMGSSNRSCLESLRKYLEAEHEDKKKAPFDTNDWRLINVKNIPQQMNGSDCGMFSCTFAEVLTRDAEITFSQEDMPYLRRKMVLEILESRLLIS